MNSYIQLSKINDRIWTLAPTHNVNSLGILLDLVTCDQVRIYIEEIRKTNIEDIHGDLIELRIVDSMSAIELFSKIEKKFSVKFSFIEYTSNDFYTIYKITESINSKRKIIK